MGLKELSTASKKCPLIEMSRPRDCVTCSLSHILGIKRVVSKSNNWVSVEYTLTEKVGLQLKQVPLSDNLMSNFGCIQREQRLQFLS